MIYNSFLYKRKKIGFFMLFSVALLCFFAPKANAVACDPIPNAPSLFQINRTSTQATLFFTPINDQIVSYTIIYGFSAGDERYNITFNSGASTGAISYTINSLQPGVQYFYKVRSNTICTFSPWSGWVSDNGGKTGTASASSKTAIPVTGSDTLVTSLLVSAGIFSLGLLLFVVAL